jgi:hypothetical protein
MRSRQFIYLVFTSRSSLTLPSALLEHRECCQVVYPVAMLGSCKGLTYVQVPTLCYFKLSSPTVPDNVRQYPTVESDSIIRHCRQRLTISYRQAFIQYLVANQISVPVAELVK